jgi:hypothetical protein
MQRLGEEYPMPRQQATLAPQTGPREENLQRHYKALNPCLAAAVLHARPSEKKQSQPMAMSQLVDDRYAEME